MKKLKWNKLELYEYIMNYLENIEEDQELICYIWKKETKEARSVFQNNFFYGLFWEISKHLWYDVQEVKMYLLSIFWNKKVKLWSKEIEIPNISNTSDLTKEQAIFFIDVILKFIQKYKIPCKYTDLDFKNLIETYNL